MYHNEWQWLKTPGKATGTVVLEPEAGKSLAEMFLVLYTEVREHLCIASGFLLIAAYSQQSCREAPLAIMDTQWFCSITPCIYLQYLQGSVTVYRWDQVCDLNTLMVFCAIAVNLLEKMLVLDAEKRVTAAEALMHPYFEPIHDPEEEIEAEKYDDTFDNLDLPLDEWKREFNFLMFSELTRLKGHAEIKMFPLTN